MRNILVLIIFLQLINQSCSGKNENEIRVGAMFDLTGQTAETGTKYADGIRNYIDYINDSGGVNGRRVRLIEIDTAYMAARDIMAYDELVYKHDVHVLFGWSTSGTEAILPRLNRDMVPCISVSLAKELADVKRAPTYFFIAPTYSDQVKIIFNYISMNRTKDRRSASAALIYSDTPFGRSPLEDARRYAKDMGIEISAEEIVHLDARDAIDQIGRIKSKNPGYVLLNETSWAASVILKEASRNRLSAKFIGLMWCADEKIINLAGRAAEGYMGVFPFLFDPDIPGIKEIIEYNRAHGLDNISPSNTSIRYINGWVAAKVMMEGVRLAGDDISRKGILRGLESIKNFDTGGITAPFTYSARSHAGYSEARLGIVQNGKWKIITGPLSSR